MEHGVEVVAVMAAGTGGGAGVRSDALFASLLFYRDAVFAPRRYMGIKVLLRANFCSWDSQGTEIKSCGFELGPIGQAEMPLEISIVSSRGTAIRKNVDAVGSVEEKLGFASNRNRLLRIVNGHWDLECESEPIMNECLRVPSQRLLAEAEMGDEMVNLLILTFEIRSVRNLPQAILVNRLIIDA